MTDESLEEVYFNWLYSKVASVDIPTPSLTWLKLLRILHSTEFVWLLSGDDNRAEDGVELRQEFLNQSHLQASESWFEIPCSVLEMLIAFSRRASFQTDDLPRDWFWVFLDNLGLGEMSDNKPKFDKQAKEWTRKYAR